MQCIHRLHDKIISCLIAVDIEHVHQLNVYRTLVQPPINKHIGSLCPPAPLRLNYGRFTHKSGLILGLHSANEGLHYKVTQSLIGWAQTYTETKMSSFWWNFHHWLHRKLSKWQLSVQPVTKISSKWWHFRFSVDSALQILNTNTDDDNDSNSNDDDDNKKRKESRDNDNLICRKFVIVHFQCHQWIWGSLNNIKMPSYQ